MALAKVGQKVKITNCSYVNVWYKDHVGQEFIVEEVIERKGINSSRGYYMLEGNNYCGVEEVDCVVVKEETMSEFKAGDKVVATATGGWYKVGEVFTLKEPYKGVYIETHGWKTEEKGDGYFIHAEDMELLKPSPKAMLKNGMRVKLRDGSLYTYIDGYFTNINTKKDGLDCLSKVDTWKDNLIYCLDGEECMLDVMEIFAASEIYDYFSYKIETESLWKRVEKTAGQLELEALQQQAQDIADRIKALQDKL